MATTTGTAPTRPGTAKPVRDRRTFWRVLLAVIAPLPMLAKGNPAGGIGIDAGSAGTTPRRDGAKQVTYKGQPLYHYAGDQTDRDAGGQGLDLFGGEWHVLTKDGQPLA